MNVLKVKGVRLTSMTALRRRAPITVPVLTAWLSTPVCAHLDSEVSSVTWTLMNVPRRRAITTPRAMNNHYKFLSLTYKVLSLLLLFSRAIVARYNNIASLKSKLSNELAY